MSKKDILSLQKGKHSVIDLDTSEPSDIQSVETDTTTDDGGFIDDFAGGLENLADGLQEKLGMESAQSEAEGTLNGEKDEQHNTQHALDTRSLNAEPYGTLHVLSKEMMPKKMTYTKSEIELGTQRKKKEMQHNARGPSFSSNGDKS